MSMCLVIGFLNVYVYIVLPPPPSPSSFCLSLSLILSLTISEENPKKKKRKTSTHLPYPPTCPLTVHNHPNQPSKSTNQPNQPKPQPPPSPPSLPPQTHFPLHLDVYSLRSQSIYSYFAPHRTASPRRPDRQTLTLPPWLKTKKKNKFVPNASTRPGKIARGDEKRIWGLWSWIMHCTAPTWRDDGGEMMEESMVGR